MTEEVEKDVLTILIEAHAPMRFSEILAELESQSIYRGKKQSLKTTLCRILGNFSDEDLILRDKRTRKNVQYSIKNRRKVRLRLGLRSSEWERILRQTEHDLHDCRFEDMSGKFLLSYLINLVQSERLMSKALAQRDEKSFRFFKRHGKNSMLCLWDVFADLVWEKRKEAREFYERKLHELEEPSIETVFVARTEYGWIINVDAYVKQACVHANIDLKWSELIVSILRNVLTKSEKHLEWARRNVLEPERVQKATTEFLKKVGRPLTYEELKRLKELMIAGNEQKD